MDEYLQNIKPPENSIMLVTRYNYGVFGESSIGGKLTSTFVKALRKEGFTIPDIKQIDKEGNIFGKKPSLINRLKKFFSKRF
jgi:hypothetical protein